MSPGSLTELKEDFYTRGCGVCCRLGVLAAVASWKGPSFDILCYCLNSGRSQCRDSGAVGYPALAKGLCMSLVIYN